MPLLYWALEDIQQEQVVGGFIITTKSDVAVHMWLRWTYKEPQKHAKPVERRGLLVSWDARFCFVEFCDVEQEEAGDTFTHTFHIPSDEPPPIPPTSDWPFYEPWGTSLTENHPWIKYKEPEVPTITFTAGVIKIENPGYEDCGITYSPPTNQLPLAYSDDKPLKIAFNNPEATANSTSSQTLIELLFRGPDEWMRIYLCVSCGAEYDYLKPWATGYVGGIPYGWLFVDTGEYTIDLLDWFKTFRADLGLSTNPAGWFLDIIAFALGTFSPETTDYLKNDYIGCYLPQTSLCNMQPWLNCETRYFYFWATNMGEKMKSTSCIFSKHFLFEAVPQTAYFYSDPHPELNTVDGWVREAVGCPECTWADLRDGPGDSSGDSGDYIRISMYAWRNEGEWSNLYRSILLFDTSTIGPGHTILSASLRVKVKVRQVGYEAWSPTYTIVSSLPAQNFTLQNSDYATLGILRLSEIIGMAEFVPERILYFDLNADGLLAIDPEGITKLGIRENTYDRANHEPPWEKYGNARLDLYSADNVDELQKPRLRVTYI